MAAIQFDQAAEATINIQENSGQLAIGKYVVQIGSVHGGEVNIAMPAEQPQWQPRPLPVLLRPRRFAGLLDRQPETGAATTALHNAEPLEFYGRPGLGKTSLLRHLSHQLPTAACPAGIVYLPARQYPLPDLLQFLYEAFFESNIPAKPTTAQIRHGLSRQQALILLDDVDLPRSDVELLLDTAPECAFLLASPEQRLWGSGRSRALGGLPPSDAQALLARELERPFTVNEEAVAPTLCRLLDGHPLHLVQVAGLAREQNLSLVEITAQLQRPSPPRALAAQLIAGLSGPERQVVGLLAALNGTPLSLEHVAELADLPDPLPVLDNLHQRQLIHSHSPRYSLTSTLAENWPPGWDLAAQSGRLLDYFTRWAEQSPPVEQMLAQADTLRRVLTNTVEAAKWPETLRLARAIENAFGLSGRWGAWAEVLQHALQAAEALGDRAAKAWVWHQLGTRALCLEDTTTAQTLLGRALRTREALGDQAGAAITRHNLNILLGPLPPSQSPPSPPTPNGTSSAGGLPWVLLGVTGLTLAALVSVLVWWTGLNSSLFSLAANPPPAPVNPPPAPTATTSVTLPSATPAAALAATATHTPQPPPTSTNTATPPSPSDTPSPTFTPTETATPTPSPTFTPTPTATFSPTPTATLPPTPTATAVPLAWLNPETLNFGSLRVNASSQPQVTTLINNGGGLLTIQSINLEGEHAADFLLDAAACQNQGNLPPNAGCTLVVRFRPTAAGNRRAILTVFTNSFNSPRTVFLSGNGQAEPIIGLDPPAVDFGEIPVGTGSRAIDVRLVNAGQAELVITGLTLGGNQPDDFDFDETCRNRVFLPGDTCTVAIRFRPTAANVRVAELIIAGNAVNAPQRVSLRGIGAAPAQPDLVVAEFEISGPARLNQQGEVLLPLAVVIRNQGGSQAEPFKVSIDYTGPDGTFVAPFTVPGQNSSWYPFSDGPLAAGDSVSFSGYVTFAARLQGQGVSLVALADSCSGDELMPPFCRVEESREDNNQSDSRSTKLPAAPIIIR